MLLNRLCKPGRSHAAATPLRIDTSPLHHTPLIPRLLQVLFWDLRTGRLAGKFEESHTEAVTCCAFHPAQRGALLTARKGRG